MSADEKRAGEPRLRVKRLKEAARLPARATEGAAGYDIASAEDLTIPAFGKACVSTGLAVGVPPGTYGRLAPRSGFTWDCHTSLEAGVCDADFRGELKVVLFNHGATAVAITRGKRIAQLILERIATPEVEEVVELEPSKRGAGGFGSTGAI